MATAVGLIGTTGPFISQFSKGRASYKCVAVCTGLFSMVVSNVGLDSIIAFAAPILTFLYPGTLVVIVLSLFDRHISNGIRQISRPLIALSDNGNSAFCRRIQSEGQPITPTPETIWEEIEKLSLPMEMNNVIFQILDEILQPLTRIDEDLTETLRGELAESLQPVERSVAPGDVLIEKGQTVTPQVARILKMQGYSQVTFPWKQILFALLALPFWPLWVLLQTSFRPSAQYRISQELLILLFFRAMMWTALS